MEIKTTIPAKSSGRLLDALTDAIRPFTEKRGLRADQIRLQREDVLLEIARKARARLAVEQAEPGVIANKFLIPFLERASLEEGTSKLTDWWSALLVAASKSPSAQKPIYVDILSKLVAEDAQFLERLWDAKATSKERWLFGSDVHWQLQKELSATILERAKLDKAEEWVADIRQLLVKQQSEWASRGCIAESMTYPTGRGRDSLLFPNIAEPIDTSIALGLLSRSHLSLSIPTPWIGEFEVSGGFVMLTLLGDALLAACHGEVR